MSPALATGPKTRTSLFLRDQAEEAARFYVSLIPDSRLEDIARAGPGGPAIVVPFILGGAPYVIINGNDDVVSTATFSISVTTEDQAETDRLWSALTADGGAEWRCGWCRDRFGIFWQVTPRVLPRLLSAGGEAGARAMDAMMTMRKIDIAAVERAAAG